MTIRSTLLIGAVVLAVSACGQSTTPTGPSASQVQSAVSAPPSGPATSTVSIMGPAANGANTANGGAAEFFSPDPTTISAGSQVTFVNADGLSHTLVADDGSWTTGNMDSEATFTVTFANAGSFRYHDAAHPEVGGTIVVK